MSDYTSLYGISNINDAVLEEQLAENLYSFFDWGLLNIGAFYNVTRPAKKSKFHLVDDSNFQYGQVWETYRGNWIWEPGSSITYPIKPIQISSPYLNGTVAPTGSYYLNYRDGQIIFNDPKPEASVVEMSYSYRRFNFYDANTDWFQQIVFDPINASQFTEILSKNRVYLPAIIVEVSKDASFVPYELGNLSVKEDQIVLFHILADRDEDRDKIIYILKRMYQKTIWLYDINKIAAENKFHFNLNGSLSSNPLTYPQLIDQFKWKRCSFINIKPQDITPQLSLFRGVVRATLQIIMP